MAAGKPPIKLLRTPYVGISPARPHAMMISVSIEKPQAFQ
jgi:hypothetical protein